MKLRHAKIENFKGIKSLEIDFVSSTLHEPRRITSLIGDNGSGKTTVMQAIALAISLATRRTESPAEFQWNGFLAERVGTFGQPKVELEVEFTEDEIRGVWEFYESFGKEDALSPWITVTNPDGNADSQRVSLHFDTKRRSRQTAWSTQGKFLGRWCAAQLATSAAKKRELLMQFGDVFWFGQDRSLGTESRSATQGSWRQNVEALRESLIGWWAYHTSGSRANGKDYIALLEEHFSRVFSGTKFIGVEPRPNVRDPGPNDFYFLLEREDKVYDFAEMSSGEQVIFSLAYEFVRLDIAKSIVLIDELELHLHPPEQQALLGALRKLGPDCQFIISTHSPYLEQPIPNEDEVRLPGGRGCL